MKQQRSLFTAEQFDSRGQRRVANRFVSFRFHGPPFRPGSFYREIGSDKRGAFAILLIAEINSTERHR